VINYQKPDFQKINGMDLAKHSAENFFIMHYITLREPSTNKKEQIQRHRTLANLFEEYGNKRTGVNYENFYTTKRPVSLQEARDTANLPKNLEGHIIVCGIVKGIKNLILPLRSKTLGSQKRPIVILTNDTIGNDTINGDTYIWPEINRFEDIYLIRGSALNPASLEKASAQKAKSIIILVKSMDQRGVKGQERLDADAIFMYKTIEAKYKNVAIVTELESMSTVAFLVKETSNDDIMQRTGYYASKPFAAGEIYVGSLLNSLMCQAYYNPKIMDILDQMIMGSANTPADILKVYKQLNLSMCSLNLVEIPKKCTSYAFQNIFEHCVKNYGMVPLGVYKRHMDEGGVVS